jgi:hypothetical protein
MLASVRPKCPTLNQLLLEGGDGRIAPGENGLNKYGCSVSPHNPQENLFSFGSATASTISQNALDAANSVYQKIVSAHLDGTHYQLYENELEAVRQELKQLCELDREPGVEIIFSASGTDLHLIAAQLFAGLSTSPILVIMAEAEETGSSVPAALSGNHFSDRSALGTPVGVGVKIDCASQIELAKIRLRDTNGNSRHIQDIDDDVDMLVKQAISENRRVFLILTDVTKTGMIGPSIATAIRLSQQYPEQLDVMVDACQFRISNASLHAYLQHHFLIAVTGSKFLTGPSFSGALFVPSKQAHRLQKRTIPHALLDYSSRADWPRDWTAADELRRVVNFGLLLRWVAALAELRAFRALSDADISQFIERFRSTIVDYFRTHPCLSLLPPFNLDRSALSTFRQWDSFPTIFSFTLNSPIGDQALCRETSMAVYRQLQKDKSMHVGQPVLCGTRDYIPVSALRLCLSARLIVAALTENGRNADKIIENALKVLDFASQLSAGFAK